ncbi:MAG: PKD domain-containing protein [Bacteroidota bacterium]|nr:PKD domain-containing protein [Bacteroidota bacterium]
MRLGNEVMLALTAVFCSSALSAQSNTYILNGSATQNSCNCYTLTQTVNNQSGSVWNSTKINLNNPFDFVFNVFLGCKDADGADGIVFILQPISTSIGGIGGGMGFQGIAPSVGIALDTWQNTGYNDPVFDHLSIQLNGDINHADDIVPYMQASPTNPNIEDCQWHTFRITWDPALKLLKTYFDGNFIQQAAIDLIATVFNNDPMVYWGFSAATGGANNLQQFCTALNPGFTVTPSGNGACDGNAVAFTNTSASFAPITHFFWDFGDGTTSTLASPPVHTYPGPGSYTIKLAITGLDGCFSDTLKKTFVVGDYPIAGFTIYDTCEGKTPRLRDLSQVNFGNINQWQWKLDGNPVSVSQYPSLTGLLPGNHNLQLTVKTDLGCSSAPVSEPFVIKPVPVVEAGFGNGCVKIPVQFTGRQTDNATTISQWNWDFGDGQTATQQNIAHSYADTGNYTVQLTSLATNGCSSEIQSLPVTINKVIANAGRDTVIIKDQPFQLNGNGGITYAWSPPIGLNNPGIANPVTILQDDIVYTLTATDANGCSDTDEISIIVFKGSAVYVPSAFTPNNDGLNDQLKPSYTGIKTLDYFEVYNRWGGLVYSTKNMSAGWDGTVNGAKQSPGVYVWMLRATDYAGKVYQLKGTSMIIR